ncbi:hypothetical protein MNB_SM-4-1501 [hydrothermal vent metagenome]|uniref:Uncharacterized protein n=1 Tax=hydrothermal vent metagenome TaxID=652676 RepID=A0A1W1BP53_9ZZZZ
MKVSVFNRTVLLMLVIMSFSNIIYKAAISPYNFFGFIDIDWKVITSFMLMYFLGNLLLPKKVKQGNISSNIVFILFMTIFIYSIYIVSDIKFYVEAFFMLKNFSINLFNSSPYFHPTTILSAWVIILITSVVLIKIIRSSNKKYKDIPENMMTSYFILFFGLIYILNTNISSFLESAKIILMQESSVMSTGYEMKWFLHIKHLLINLIILFIYGGLIFFIEHKYKFVFKKHIIFFTTTIIVIIGAYSFKAFVGQVDFGKYCL